MSDYDIFLNKLFKLIPMLEGFYQKEINDYLPDELNMGIFMSDLGREILKIGFHNDEITRKLFTIIEEGYSSEVIGDIIATCLIESLYFNAKNEDKNTILSLMEENSRNYIIEFCGIFGIPISE
ncbi:hypothetical protein [Acinetobacter sp. YH12145]|uniref:DUF7674 family protein n=1 Tax=Acinetobacter sp. YH12145 TaxID=2601129 RepID=UPI0015D1D97A|nr:hypothetical protein [Acinetobacter sp. YH12145]